MDAAQLEPVLDDDLRIRRVSFGPVDVETFWAVQRCIADEGVPEALCSAFLRRLAERVADRAEWVRTIRLLLCSMYGIGCDSAFFDAVLAAQVEASDGATIALSEARRIGAEFGFDWLDEACRPGPAAGTTHRAAA